jgi:ribonuclease D
MAELQEQVVTRPEELPACCEYLAGSRIFGLDTEFVGEDTYHPHLCLIQVATDERLILIDPMTVGPLDAFWACVTDPNNQVIVHAGREEVRLCHHHTGGRAPGNLFDLQLAAGMVGMTYPIGHASLVYHLLGVQLAKGETLTEWRDRPLTRAQIRYALDDVRYLLPLWRALTATLEQRRRLDWAREEFGRLARSVTLDDPAGPIVERWRKLRGTGTLDRRRLAVVRELFGWREEMAARLNRPARVICRDDLIIEIARRNPAKERDLTVVRGLPRRDLKDILAVVERARAIPIEECPTPAEREQDSPQVTMVSGIIAAVLGDWCARNQITQNLVASSNDVKLLVRAAFQDRPIPPESLLAHGWRRQHVLPELEAVLRGRRSVRIADLAADAPLELEERKSSQKPNE